MDTWFSIAPLPSNDFFEPRTWGRVYILPSNFTLGGYYASDERKDLYYDISFDYRKFTGKERKSVNFNLNIRYRFNNHFSMDYTVNPENKYADIGFVNSLEDAIFFGKRDVKTVSNTLSGSYIFTKSISLTLRLRHYHSKAYYHQYSLLTEEGNLKSADYTDNHNTNFNAFNIDMVFSWLFAPGSEIRIVWKDASLIKEQQVINGYFNNLKENLYSRQNTNLSIKILYYLDAGKWINRFKQDRNSK
jgi:long-subunit fatty acid transport protein